jgi:hypothetical protein
MAFIYRRSTFVSANSAVMKSQKTSGEYGIVVKMQSRHRTLIFNGNKIAILFT